MELHGLQGNPNWLGLLLAVTLPLQVDLLARLRRGCSRWWWLVALSCSLTVGALVLAASRVAVAALAVTAAVFVAGRWRKVASVGLGLAVAGAAFSLQGSLAAWSGRWWIWRVSLHEATDALPLGVGVGRFAHGFLDAQGELLARLPLEQAAARFANATTAHGDWLEVLTVGGPVALVLLGAVVGSAIAGLRQRFRAGAAAVVVAALCALGDSPLAQPGLVAVLALILATAPRRPLRGRRRTLFVAVYAMVLASSILLLPSSTARWMGERAVTAARRAGLDQRMALLHRAHRLWPRSGETTLLVGLGHLETDAPIRAVPWLEHSRRHLANLGTDVALGNAWLRSGRPDRAAAAYRRALDRHPGYFRAHANLVEALRNLGRLDQAEQHLRTARRLQPGHPKLAGIAERLRRARIERETSR